jgi:Tfp pilus assembly protein PilF
VGYCTFNASKAEKNYKKALKLEPDNANPNGNYAIFLTKIHKKHDQAEKHYKKALELDPDHANNNRNYANFLEVIRKNYDQAEAYYKKSLELKPDNAIVNGNYAFFFHHQVQVLRIFCNTLLLGRNFFIKNP